MIYSRHDFVEKALFTKFYEFDVDMNFFPLCLVTWILENELGMKNMSYDHGTFAPFYMCSILSEK